MAARNVKRGYDPDDKKVFSVDNVRKLRIIQEEVQWLLTGDTK